MERLTERALRVPIGLLDNSMPVDCCVYCKNHKGGCQNCDIYRSFEKLADYEDAEERRPMRIIRTREIADFYSYESQSRQCIEECAELIQAINKLWREMKEDDILATEEEDILSSKDSPKGADSKYIKEALSHVCDEIADVQIMLWQMERKLDCRREVDSAIDAKLWRQVDRIEEIENEWGVMTTIKTRIAIDRAFKEGEPQNRGG